MKNYAANAILTKARAKYGKRVTINNYTAMMSMSNEADVTAYLQRDYNSTDLLKFARAVGEDFYEFILLEDEMNRKLKETTSNYTEIETQLKKELYEKLFEILKKLPKDEQKELGDLFKLKIETENIARIYRDKKFYKTDDTLLPCRRYLKKPQVQSLLDARDELEVAELLKGTIYGKFFAEIEYYTIDDLLKKIYLKSVQRKMHTSPYPSVVMYCCIKLFEFEEKNIINITQGVKYKLSVGEINKLLVL
ncbi:MAG: V-type ATPase subunit [Oscillospiraceae bacterium]|nr:V-type ATPase subunit [Oscillospiraceae bacterium]